MFALWHLAASVMGAGPEALILVHGVTTVCVLSVRVSRLPARPWRHPDFSALKAASVSDRPLLRLATGQGSCREPQQVEAAGEVVL